MVCSKSWGPSWRAVSRLVESAKQRKGTGLVSPRNGVTSIEPAGEQSSDDSEAVDAILFDRPKVRNSKPKLLSNMNSKKKSELKKKELP